MMLWGMNNTILYLVVFATFSTNSYAGTTLNWQDTAPEFEEATTQPLPLAPIDQIRVKIFPHNGIYSAPQGREKNMNAIQFSSKAECTRTTLQGTSVTTETLPAGTRTRLATQSKKLNGELRVHLQCAGPIMVIREAGMDSYVYQGEITALIKNAQLEVINLVSFETYLKGVVPAEMPARWAPEALKAQAIAARTYAAFQILKARHEHPNSDYDVDDTIQYQAYLGASWQTPTTNEAVESTQGVVLVSQNSPIVAYFSSDSGGYTETAKNIWGDRFDVPYTPSKREAYPLTEINSAWSEGMTLEEIRTKLVERLNFPNNISIKDISVHSVTESGRAKEIAVETTSKSAPIIIWGEDFRRAMRLKSTLFTISEKNKNSYTFNGRGFGHGVGMNQTGAQILASKLNWTHDQILRFYYEGSEFARMN